MVGQQFKTVDVLRLEVEADPIGAVNLVQNPNGELGGWGWLTPVANTTLAGGPDGLTLTTTVTQATHAATEFLPATPGEYLGGRFVVAATSGGSVTVRGRFVFLDADGAVLSSGPQSAPGGAGATVQVAAALVPASTVYAQLRVDAYTSGGDLAANAWARFYGATVVASATSGGLGSIRTNLFPQPRLESGSTVTLALGTVAATYGFETTDAAYIYAGSASLWWGRASPTGTGRPIVYLAPVPVTPGRYYAIQGQVKARQADAGIEVRLVTRWRRADSTVIDNPELDRAVVPQAWTRLSGVAAAPSEAASLEVAFQIQTPSPATITYALDAVMVEQAETVGSYFDGATPDAGGVDYAWTGAANNSTSTATVAGDLAYLPPMEWLSLLGTAHDIRVAREELNLGTVEGTILDATLDPSQADTLRPGRRLRLTALADDTRWVPLFTGELRRAQVTYDPLAPSNKQARISFLAVDNTAALANSRRPDGVETIGELPYVLEGCGVPWNVNGSGDQVPTATVVAVNENASAADQVAITRDSNLGRAWVDRHNVLQVWDADQIDTTVQAVLDETAYSSVSVDYDTERCINYVTVKVTRIGPSGDTEEVPYGPYIDSASVATWGVRSAEFTVQWADADEASVATFAGAILTANATPVVRINALTMPIRTVDDLSDVTGSRRALLDLYDLVTASNAGTGVSSDSRITKLSHEITGTSWVMSIDFSTEGGVAAPQETPPLPSTRVSDWWPEVRMLHGAKALCPLDFLVMDGGTFTPTDYPELAAHLVALGLPSGVLPDYTDVFPIGAGTKAVGTSGGSPTKTIAAANLPPHTHGMSAVTVPSTSAATGSSASRLARGTTTNDGDISPLTGQSGTGTGLTNDPLDVMNPWRAVYFVIRAR